MKESQRIGFAGRLAAAFINSKLTPLIILASLLMGGFAILKTPREEEPQIVVPMIDVIVTMPGASSQEIEQRVTTPMEKLVWEIPGVEYVYSTSSPGQSMVIVRYLVGQNQEASLVKLREKLQSHYDLIPPGASLPIIKPRSIDDVPILAITLHSVHYDSFALRQLASRVENAVKQVDDVSETAIIGGRRREMRVVLDKAKLAGYSMSADNVLQSIAGSNQRVHSGDISRENDEIAVNSGSFLRTKSDVGNVSIGSTNGRALFVRDVAIVTDGPEDADNYVWYGRGKAEHVAGEAGEAKTQPGNETNNTIEPAVTISVAKRQGKNAIDIADHVLAKLDSLKWTVIPAGVTVSVTRNYGETASEKSGELLYHMLIAIVSVTLLIALALGRREAMVVAIAIPVTLALTLLVFYLYGYTLNRITLFALIFSIGILVDDAIVVVENIVRHYRMPVGERQEPLDAAIHAVDEVGNPTILATFAVIAAILPMAFVGGLMGPYMRPIPVGASAAMLFSLVIAFIVTPYAALRLLRNQRSDKSTDSKPGDSFAHGHSDDWTTRLYRRIMSPLLHSWKVRWSFFGFVTALLFAAIALVGYKFVTVKMLPFDNKNEFQIIVDMPTGTTLEQTAAATKALGDYVATIPEVRNYQLYVGTASPFNFNGLVRHYFTRNASYQADIQVNLVGKSDRKAQSHGIAKRIRPEIERIAKQWGVRVKLAEVPPGPPVLQTLVAEIYGPTSLRRTEVARDVKHVFETTNGVSDVDWYMDDDQTTVDLQVDKEKAALSGIDTATVNRTLTMALSGILVGLAHDESSREDVPIKVQLPRSERSGLGDLGQLYLSASGRNASGLVPLSEFVHAKTIPTDKSIYHKNLLPVVYVTGDVVGRQESPVYAVMAMNSKIDSLKLPEGYKLNILSTHIPTSTDKLQMKWDGEWHITYEVFRDLGIAFAAVLALIYILVVAWFQSFKTPLVIMAPIPLTLVGILPAHALMGAFFTATSMIGFIAGAGIIVRNSIILVDFIELRVRQGMPLDQAVIDAGATRFRPMLLTATAVIVGSSVILFDPIFQGLAISLMAGEVASTLLSRLAVPVLYYMVRSRETTVNSLGVPFEPGTVVVSFGNNNA